MGLVLSEFTSKRDLVTKVKTIFTINDFNLETITDSEVFTIGSNEWQIKVYPKNVKEGIDHLGCCIQLCKSNESKVLAKFQCFLINSGFDFVHPFHSREINFDVNDLGWGHELLTQDQLIAQKDQLMPNNVLTIGFNIEINTKVIDYGLRHDFSNQFNVKDINSFEIIVGKKSIFVSKLILSSRSEVFRAMFTTDMTERQTNQLIVEDIDEEVMEEFLKYLYFGYTSRLEALVEELLLVSDKYQVLDLKTICEKLLHFGLKPKNVIKRLKLFQTLNCNEMVNKTIDFITDNMSQFKDNQMFELFYSEKEIMKEIFNAMVDKINAKEVEKRKQTLKVFSQSYYK